MVHPIEKSTRNRFTTKPRIRMSRRERLIQRAFETGTLIEVLKTRPGDRLLHKGNKFLVVPVKQIRYDRHLYAVRCNGISVIDYGYNLKGQGYNKLGIQKYKWAGPCDIPLANYDPESVVG